MTDEPKSNGSSPFVEVPSDEVHIVRRIKRRAIEITLSDGQIVYVFEPKTEHMGTFLRALPSLNAIADSFKTAAIAADGVIGIPNEIPDAVYEGLFPLIAIMANMTVEEYKDLPLFDGIALLRALTLFAPKNLPAAAPTTS